MTRWNWMVDVSIAFALAAFTLDDAMHRGQHADAGHGLVTGGVPQPPHPSCPAQYIYYFGPAQSWELVLAVLTAAPLALRRRYPLAAFWAVLILSQILHFSRGFDPTFTLVACVIAAYSATVYSPYRMAALISALAGVAVIVIFHKYDLPDNRPSLPTLLLLIPIVLAVNAFHTWQQRAKALESEKVVATIAAVEGERSRIARELHDVITHNVSMMVVQAGAARKVMDGDPRQAREALLAVESGGRLAMTELRHAMGLLTMNGDRSAQAADELTPQPGLDAVPNLVARVRDTGVPVELATAGVPRPLPQGKDLAAYRVVQEALTNTVKHAVGAHVRISLEYVSDGVHIEVTDTGGVSAGSVGTGNSRGLIGLQGRLAVYHGTLQAGRTPDGGYRVHAVIPTEDS
jgi:signal transduction histidine kinase